MPSDSPWPITLAAALALVFVFLLTGHWTTALVFAGAVAAVLAAWHWREGAAELAAGVRRALPNGWWGMAIVPGHGGDAVRLADRHLLLPALHVAASGRRAGSRRRRVALPIVLTAVLVLSALPFAGGRRARPAAGARGAAWLVVALALALQARLPRGADRRATSTTSATFAPTTNAYGSIYFTLLGAHHAHVVVGLLLDVWLLVRLRGGLTRYRVGRRPRDRAVLVRGRRDRRSFVVATQVSPS